MLYLCLLLLGLFGILKWFGNEEIPDEEIIKILEENNVKIGTYKKKIDKEKLMNKIRLDRNDISWVGIELKGTNLKISISEADLAPSVDNPKEINNIVADRDGEIAKLIVQSGTARVKEGDIVQKGDLLVEGIMEGQYTGIREVPAKAEIFAKVIYEKEEKTQFLQEKEVKTGNKEKRIEIKINKFIINFNKRVSKFEKYDTIVTTKKLKFFSNYYLPIEVSKITNLETKLEHKEYTVPELTDKIKLELEQKLNEELKLNNSDGIEENLEVNVEGQEVYVKLIYTMYDKIGTKEI